MGSDSDVWIWHLALPSDYRAKYYRLLATKEINNKYLATRARGYIAELLDELWREHVAGKPETKKILESVEPEGLVIVKLDDTELKKNANQDFQGGIFMREGV